MTQQRWQQLTEWPLVVAAVLFLAAYSTQVIGDLHGVPAAICDTVVGLTWLAFAIDYVVELVLAKRRAHWFATHLLDLAIVALPAFRPLRLLRLVNLLAALRKATGRVVRERVIVFAIAAGIMVIYVGAVAELDAERGHGNIRSFGDALWWAVATITTVGYGDYEPVTFEGRLVAVCVMAGGIALIGIVTATIASWIVQRVNDVDELEQAATRHQVESLAAEVAALRERLERGPLDGDRARSDVSD